MKTERFAARLGLADELVEPLRPQRPLGRVVDQRLGAQGRIGVGSGAAT